MNIKLDDLVQHNLEYLLKEGTCYNLDIPTNCEVTLAELESYMELHGLLDRTDKSYSISYKGREILRTSTWVLHCKRENERKQDEEEKQNRPTNQLIINAPISGSQIGIQSRFSKLYNKDKVENITVADKETISQKSKFDIKNIFQYVAWFAGIASAILAYWRFIYSK
jgi:hypothetical protein